MARPCSLGSYWGDIDLLKWDELPELQAPAICQM
jgi:hypothetical protein